MWIACQMLDMYAMQDEADISKMDKTYLRVSEYLESSKIIYAGR
jgi:hypothetical protein